MHITKWKKPIWKGYILCDSDYTTFWKRQNYGDSGRIGGCQRLEEGGLKRQSTEDILGQWNHSVWYNNGEYVSLYICANP